MIGQTLSHYRITSALGAGGMGEVYRATDTRLGREVAIKLLPEGFSSDPERLARFDREARLLAAVNHPNVAQVYGFESVTRSDGSAAHFLAMELVEGEDLAERLKRGPVPVEDAIPIARQVAEALEEAHEKGIVHRDLKPANVKVTPDGKVKVLDFGLAKAWTGADDPLSGSAPALSQSPTLAHTGTAAGLILGTAAYMSPEQARGKPVDKRADIWAFGVVLFEMLTGRKLFAGETVTDVLAAVVRQEIDWSALPASTPPGVSRLLHRCLERDTKGRLRDIGEARVALASPLEETRRDETGTAGKRAGWILPATAAAVVLAFAAGYLARRPATVPASVFDADAFVRQLTFEPGLEAEPSFSPDGNYVAYTSNDQGSLDVVVMPLGGGQVRRLAASPADEAQPAWSPDGTQVAFTSARDRGGRLSATNGLSALSAFVQGQGGDIFLAPAAGGPPVKLVERGSYPAWSPDGHSVAFQSDRSGHWDIWTVPARGGEPRPLTADGEIDYQPAWSPDGKWIAYASVQSQARGRLRIVPADGTGKPRDLNLPGDTVARPAWSPDGAWLYFATGRSLAVAKTTLSRVSFATIGDATPLVQRVTLGASADIDPDVAASGRQLAYAGVSYSPDLWVLDLKTGAQRPLTSTSCLEDYPDLSPDGRTLLFFSDRTGEPALYTLDLEGGAWQPLNSEGRAHMPRWSPDGRTVAFVGFAPEGVSLALQAVGSLSVKDLVTLPRPASLQAPVWAPDGRSLAFSQTLPDGRSSIRVVDLAGSVREVAAPGGAAMFATWSPDGRFLAFQHEKDGPRQIWVAPAEGGEAHAISRGTQELSHPQWSAKHPDQVLVVVDHKNLATVSVSTGALTPLTHFDDSTRYVDYPSWSPDGTQVYFSMTRKVGDLFLLESR